MKKQDKRICNTPGCKREVYIGNNPENKFGQCEDCLLKIRWSKL